MLEIILLSTLGIAMILAYFSDNNYAQNALAILGTILGIIAIYYATILHQYITTLCIGITAAIAIYAGKKETLCGITPKKIYIGSLFLIGLTCWLFQIFLPNLSTPSSFIFFPLIVSSSSYIYKTLGITTATFLLLALMIGLWNIKKGQIIKSFLHYFIITLWISLSIGQFFSYRFLKPFNVNQLQLSRNIYWGFGANAKNKDGKTPIFDAIQKGDLDAVKMLVSKKADLNYQTGFIGGPLSYAITNNQYDIFYYLINQGADYKALVKTTKQSLLQVAAQSNSDIRFIQTLVNLGMDVNQAEPKTHSVLHCAAKGKFDWKEKRFISKIDIIDFLVKNGADVNAAGPYHEFDTPLYQAVTNANFEAVKRLIELGANPYPEGAQYRDTRMMHRFHDSLLDLAKTIYNHPTDNENAYSSSKKDRMQKIIAFLTELAKQKDINNNQAL